MAPSLVCGHAECVVGLPCRRGMSQHCARGLHGFCKIGKTGGCTCTDCHLGPCTRCHRDDLKKMFADGTLCADCYRDDAQAAPPPVTMCESCHAHSGFRNPGTRRNEFFCASCHAARGETLALASSVTQLVAACHGADITDQRHDWVHVKGNTFGCASCKIKSYDPELRKEMRRRELNDR